MEKRLVIDEKTKAKGKGKSLKGDGRPNKHGN